MILIKEYLRAMYLLADDFLVWKNGGKSLFNYGDLLRFKRK